MSALVRLIVCAVTLVAGASGCVHAVVIEATPPDATIFVDGAEQGRGPVRVDKAVYVGDTLRVRAEREGYESAVVQVPASELFIWPGLLAVVPLLGIPLSLPTLIVPVLGPFIAAAIAASWAVVTSPLLLSLALTRKYPDKVTVTLKKKPKVDPLTPDDLFGDPYDLGQNPLPDIGVKKNTPNSAPNKRPTVPDGANPPPL